MLRVGIILGSTRPGRNGEAVARWVYEIAQRRTDAEFELVDLKDFNLPLLDEPVPPSLGQYSKEHTKVWAAKIASDRKSTRLNSSHGYISYAVFCLKKK